MTLENRIEGLIKLGAYLRTKDDALDDVIENTSRSNKWFTAANQCTALDAIATQMLEQAKLSAFANAYSMPTEQKRIGLIPAGNIPLVGFHDFLCIFLAGHKAIIKSSEKDPYWLPFLTNKLVELQPESASSFEFVDTLKGYDAVIATGSNNSSRYFETYFKHVPNIIRQNRNSVAILDGTESTADLRLLADDIFTYFGLGCRNVSKLYVPIGYNFEALLEVFHEHKELILHNKYQNNFDYNIVLYLLNKIPYKNNGCIILTEGNAFSTRIASLNYQFYSGLQEVELELSTHQNEIQCIVSKQPLRTLSTLRFGQSQRPELQDFADGIDTMAFLTTL